MITKHTVPGWTGEQVERYFVYNNPEHPAFTVRQNCVSGVVEVLKNVPRESVADPLQRVVFVHSGKLGSDGKEALDLGMLCAKVGATQYAMNMILVDLAPEGGCGNVPQSVAIKDQA